MGAAQEAFGIPRGRSDGGDFVSTRTAPDTSPRQHRIASKQQQQTVVGRYGESLRNSEGSAGATTPHHLTSTFSADGQSATRGSQLLSVSTVSRLASQVRRSSWELVHQASPSEYVLGTLATASELPVANLAPLTCEDDEGSTEELAEDTPKAITLLKIKIDDGRSEFETDMSGIENQAQSFETALEVRTCTLRWFCTSTETQSSSSALLASSFQLIMLSWLVQCVFISSWLV